MIFLMRSEWLKYRRTLTPWFIVCGPLILVLAQFAFSLISRVGTTWNEALLTVYNWWGVLAVPFGVILLAMLAVSYERRSGSWRILISYPIRPWKLYLAKYFVLSLQTLVASALFVLFLLLLGFWHLSGPIPWVHLWSGLFIPWLTAWAQMAIMLWIATALGYGLTIVIGLAGMISGIIMAQSGAFILNPWAWPIRALEPIMGFHVNGLPLEPNSPLWNTGINHTLIAFGVIWSIIFVTIGSFWFNRREVR